jgi:hypothetical protein
MDCSKSHSNIIKNIKKAKTGAYREGGKQARFVKLVTHYNSPNRILSSDR